MTLKLVFLWFQILHRIYPETAREREREWCWWDVHQHHVWRGDVHFAEWRVGAAFRSWKKEGLWCSDWVAALKTWNDWLLEIKFCKFCLSKSQQLTGILQVSKASQFDEGSSTCFYRPLTYLEGGKENIATWMKKMAESWEENGKTKFLLVIFVNLLAEEASLWLYRDPFVSQPLEHSTSRRSWWETRWRKDSWHVYTCL